jgi:tripeptide aminopeptidase
MSTATSSVDVKAAEDHLMKFLSVEGVTGQEAAIAAAVSDELRKVGVRIRHTFRRREQAHSAADANRQLDRGPSGTRPGPRLLFATHPRYSTALWPREAERQRGLSPTAPPHLAATIARLRGARDLPETLLTRKLPHPPIRLRLPCARESGLHGARELKPADWRGCNVLQR